MDTRNIIQQNGTAIQIAKQDCPASYIRGILITPVQYTQQVQQITVPAHTGLGTGTGSGALQSDGKSVKVDTVNTNVNVNSIIIPAANITQHDPISIVVVNNINEDRWDVNLRYGAADPTAADPIRALVQEYCIYRTTRARGVLSFRAYETYNPALWTQARPAVSNRTCTVNADCANTEICTSGVCTVMGTCTGKDGDKVSGNVYCVNGQQVEISCKKDSDCGTGHVCADYRCK